MVALETNAMPSLIALPPLFLFFRKVSDLRRILILFETLKDDLAHRLPLRERFRLDLVP